MSDPGSGMFRYNSATFGSITIFAIDATTRESTDVVSGSDRLIWLCTSFSIFKNKSDEEIAEDGPEVGNKKLVPIVARHGPALEDGDYINMSMEGGLAKITEKATRN